MKTKKITMIAMLSAVAYVVMAVGRFPMMSIPGLTLKYDPKDVIIVIGGFIYGPLAAFAISVLSSLTEMLSVSETGPIGLLMNVVASCCFACTAALIYKFKRTIAGAVAGLAIGGVLTAFVMVLWNFLISPLYLGIPRAAMTPFLFTFFFPYNLIKCGINAAVTMMLYKPVSKILRAMTGTPLSPPLSGGELPPSGGELPPGRKNTALVYIVSAAALAVFAAAAVWLNWQ